MEQGDNSEEQCKDPRNNSTEQNSLCVYIYIFYTYIES